MNKEDKLKALDAALTKIEKDFGKGSVMKLGEANTLSFHLHTQITHLSQPNRQKKQISRKAILTFVTSPYNRFFQAFIYHRQ